MKKLFTTLALFAGLSIGAFAQQCYTGANGITPHISSTPGLSPNSDSLACSVTGTDVNDTIYFTNFTSFNSIPVDSLTIDSIGNLPTGTCWTTSSRTNTFAGGQSGVIYVHGHNTAAPGQYSLAIFITGYLSGGLVVGPNANANALAGLYYWVRVLSSSVCECPALDTVNGKLHAFLPYTACDTSTGINELANNLTNVSVVPNPFTSSATMTFVSTVEGTFTLKMMNLLGEVVTTKEIPVTRGSNQTILERNSLSSGIYILSVSNGNGSISKKVIID
jgi:hypothetical protein